MFDVDDRALNEHDGYPDFEEDSFDPAIAEEELATLSAHLDAATYRQFVLIRQLDDCGHWAIAGAATCAAWLSFRIGMDLGAARERLRVAHALRDLRKISEAVRRGTTSYSKVRATFPRKGPTCRRSSLRTVPRSATFPRKTPAGYP